METWCIILFIVMAIVMFFCGWMLAWRWKEAEDDEETESEKVIVLHQYKTSTDYHRLYQLLMDGRYIIRLKRYNFTGEFITYEMYRHDLYDSDDFVIFGMDSDREEFKNIGEEDFVNYCKWKKIEYLDQI